MSKIENSKEFRKKFREKVNATREAVLGDVEKSGKQITKEEATAVAVMMGVQQLIFERSWGGIDVDTYKKALRIEKMFQKSPGWLSYTQQEGVKVLVEQKKENTNLEKTNVSRLEESVITPEAISVLRGVLNTDELPENPTREQFATFVEFKRKALKSQGFWQAMRLSEQKK